MATFGHMAKNGNCVLNGVNKTAFSGISTLFYIKLFCKIILAENCNQTYIWPNLTIIWPQMAILSWVESITLPYLESPPFLYIKLACKIILPQNCNWTYIWPILATIWPKMAILSWVGSIRLLFLESPSFLHKIVV